MKIPAELQGVLISTPDTLGGNVRFKGTRVPLQALLDTIQRGHGIDYFLAGWPDVSEEQATTFISWQQNQAREMFGLESVA
jgi:uncharacterized protein (DUF433 family)